MLTEEMRLDGNAAAGLLREIFVNDVTSSVVTCAGCGRVGAIATLLEYGHAMGVVLRCPACDGAVLRIVRTSDALHVDFSGLSLFTLTSFASLPQDDAGRQ